MMRKALYHFLFAMVLAAAALSVGCAGTESENVSVEPWNTPRSWEHGLPPAMFEGR